ncbi:Dynamin-2B [Cocos nucifera]|uniref:Dynamin-2B n=1 Tax=Cocos nucifera TaxID=13894 RepID=A0A8K0MUA4_COCNU|nr:Dynamin-2B [Cocos nucifera]
MIQAAALLADEDPDEPSSKRTSTFLNVVALGNVGAGKSAVLNSLIGHPVLPTGENGATRAPINIDLRTDGSLSSKSIILQIDNKSQQVSASALRHSLQDRLSRGTGVHSSGKSRSDEIYLKLRTSTAPPLKLIDLPGLDQRAMDESMISDYAAHNDAILLVIVPAAQAPEVSSSRALRLAKEFDVEGTRTIGVVSKIDQAAGDQKSLAAVQALLLNQGPSRTSDIPWVALIGQSVSIASAQAGSVGSENSLETAWRAESESLKSILTGVPQSKLGRVALVDNLAKQIRKRMKLRLPNLLSGLQGKSQIVQDELVRLGEQMVQSAEGTKAIALELCREFEDKFLAHIAGVANLRLGYIIMCLHSLYLLTSENSKAMTRDYKIVGPLNFMAFKRSIVKDTHADCMGAGWKVVASFEGNFPNRIKQLPLDRHFDINNVKRIVLEADGYQPYLISPEKGLRSLIKGVLDLAKEPARLCVDEFCFVMEFVHLYFTGFISMFLISKYRQVHRVLIDIVSAAANATPGLGRYLSYKREVIAIASAALEGFRNEAKKMVIALVDMERAFVPPQHFIRLVQRRMDRQRREEELKNRSSKKAHEAEQAILNRATSPQPGSQPTGGSMKSMKEKSNQTEKDAKEGSALQVAGPSGEITADEEEPPKSSKDSKKVNGPDSGKGPSLVFKITSKVPYKTVLKAHSAVVLKAENMADKVEWVNKIRNIVQPSKRSPQKGMAGSEANPSMRQSLSDGSLETMSRRPVDPEEELRWMSQEVRGYVEAVLNSLAANVPKAVVLCQVEKAKEDMLNQLYSSVSVQSTARIEELLQEDQNVKRRREKFQRQSSLLSKLTRQLSIHDNRAAAASWSSNGTGAESSPRANALGDDWRSAFDAAANGPVDRSFDRSSSNGHGRRYSDPAQNGDASGGPNSGSRRTPNRLPPPPPQSSSSVYRY